MKFQGILPAIVTPLDSKERFHEQAFSQLCERFYAAGVDGLYVCGQTGEGPDLPSSERKRAAETALRVSPAGKTVIVHVGARSLRQSVDLARHAEKTGAHAISSLPPGARYSFEETRNYYRELAASVHIPVLIYYFPALAPNLTHIDQILELAALPNVIGLKFTDSDMFKLWDLVRHGATVFMGSDEMLSAGLLMGAHGGIGGTYNVMPPLFVEMYAHARAGRWKQAKNVQDIVNPIVDAILRSPPLGAIKQMLEWSGIKAGLPVAPRRGLSAEEQAALADRLRSLPWIGKHSGLVLPG
ncbi:MAG: dihydrodipicolinate synthase family protein [Bryobacteraceae bacterium]